MVSVEPVDPNQTFSGTLVILAPHMDDEALACGGLIAMLLNKERIHVIYATDGMKSPAPVMPRYDTISPDLGKVRIKESIAALVFLGLSEENLRFLGLPEAQLKENKAGLRRSLLEAVDEINPDYIFMPFRYDRHHDHLAVNHVIMQGQKQGRIRAQIVEYFVYHRWRLLPQKDIRKYIKVEGLVKIDTSSVMKKKRMALNFFNSQATLYYPWQTRPILTSQLLDEESENPEYFLFYNPALPGAAVFSRAVIWIKFVHRVEPLIKDWMYLTGTLLKRALRSSARHAG